MKKILLLTMSHAVVAFVGFALGIYALPIITAPPAPEMAVIEKAAAEALYSAQFSRELEDSDALHWGEGTVSIGPSMISLVGKLAPGPDYKIYLSPEFVETEARFKQLKDRMVQVGDVKTFENFIVDIPATIDPSQFNSVIVWCESFDQFITSAQYR